MKLLSLRRTHESRGFWFHFVSGTDTFHPLQIFLSQLCVCLFGLFCLCLFLDWDLENCLYQYLIVEYWANDCHYLYEEKKPAMTAGLPSSQWLFEQDVHGGLL